MIKPNRLPNAVKQNRCECEDAHDGHPIHKHECTHVEECHVTNPRCTVRGTLTTLYRVDMEDANGTAFCEHCAADAAESGLFSERES